MGRKQLTDPIPSQQSIPKFQLIVTSNTSHTQLPHLLNRSSGIGRTKKKPNIMGKEEHNDERSVSGDALPAKNAWVIVEKRKVDSP
jgi:hypothetical protein